MKLHSQIFVIIVTYNGMKWIPKCLNAIFKSSIDINVVVVDNCSKDEGAEFVLDHFPQVHLIRSKDNLGFGRANNIGIKYALDHGASHFLLLNQDAYVHPNMIEGLISVSNANPEYGVLSPLQLNGGGNTLDVNFARAILPLKFEKFDIVEHLHTPIFPVKFVMAAVWLVTLQCIKHIGGFDPVFPHYGEDDDYLNRVRYHGYKIGVVPYVKANHDREFRTQTTEKRIHINYVQFLGILKNINHSKLTASLFAITKGFGKSLVYGFSGNIKLSFGTIQGLLKALNKIKEINNSRKISLTKGPAYL